MCHAIWLQNYFSNWNYALQLNINKHTCTLINMHMYKHKLSNVRHALQHFKMLEFKSRKITPFSSISTSSKLTIVVMGSDPYFISFLHFYVCIRGWHYKSWVVWTTSTIRAIVRHWNIVKNDFSNEIFSCVWKNCPAEEINSIYRRSKLSRSGIVSVAFIQRNQIEYHCLIGFQVFQVTFEWWLESNWTCATFWNKIFCKVLYTKLLVYLSILKWGNRLFI